MLMRLRHPDLRGEAEFASGQNTEDAPLVVGSGSSGEAEGWSLVAKVIFFLGIVSAVAVGLRIKQKREYQEVMQEKAWNA